MLFGLGVLVGIVLTVVAAVAVLIYGSMQEDDEMEAHVARDKKIVEFRSVKA